MHPSFAPLGDAIDERLSARIRARGRSLERAAVDGVRERVPGYALPVVVASADLAQLAQRATIEAGTR